MTHDDMRAGYRSRLSGAVATAWLALAALWPGAAWALDSSTRLEDYNRTTWTAREGAPSRILNMMQTSDGWIWIVSDTGLYRFDGMQFEPVKLPGQDSPGRGRLASIFPGPNGELWINYAVTGGFAIVHADGRLEDVAAPSGMFGSVRQFALAPDGTRWAATDRGLRYFRGKVEYAPGLDAGLPVEDTCSLLFEPDGTLWLTTIHGIYRRPAGTVKFEKRGDTHGPSSLIRSPDGRIWLAAFTEDRVELLSGRAPGLLPPAPVTSRFTSLFDRDGNLWTASCPGRLCVTHPEAISGKILLHPAAMHRATPAQAAEQPIAVMEDRAGAIWMATSNTIERFRDSRLVQVHFPGDVEISLARDNNGRVWAADSDAAKVWMLTTAGAVADPTRAVQMIANSPDGAFLVAEKRSIERTLGNRVERIALPPGLDGKVTDLNILGLTDDGREIWMFSRQTGLMAYADGQWKPRSQFNLPKVIMHGGPVGRGKIWFYDAEGAMNLYDNGKLSAIDARLIGVATYLDTGAHVVICGDHGMAVLQGKTFAGLTAADPAVLLAVSGIAVSRNGDRWLNGSKGVVHVRAADWQASMARPATPLRYELIDALDGYRGQAFVDNRQLSALADRDDQLWFATTEGVLRLDATKVSRASFVPRIGITTMTSDGAALRPDAGLVLPPLPRSVSIGYAAPGAGKPEDLRYQYRLRGEEPLWQDAGARRTAFYTNLAPGPHVFEVRAASADGAWSAAPATLAFAVTPTLLQTSWFRGLLGFLLAGALYGLYRWRLRVIAAQLRARMNARLDERNRIARELHDTLLQSVQGMMLKVHGAASRLAPDEPVRALLESAMDQAESAIGEARAHVRDLRGDDAALPLATLLAAVGKELAGTDGPVFHVRVHGAVKTLRSDAARECFAIGREALLNAFRHAGARVITVQIDHTRTALRLRVEDDGAGMAKDVAAAGGRPGHWGVDGMRERTQGLDGQFTLHSAPGEGTRIAVTIPAARAYAEPGRTARWPFPS